jgi:hypothetical protein
MRRRRSRVFSIRALLLFFSLVGSSLACGGEPQIRPQIGIERSGERFEPLSKGVRVKIFFRGEPDVSYREIGTITSTCPVMHWVGGRHEKGRPLCVDGLRQGARKIGAQAVVDIEAKTFRPSWEPESPWLIMKGVAVRLSH